MQLFFKSHSRKIVTSKKYLNIVFHIYICSYLCQCSLIVSFECKFLHMGHTFLFLYMSCNILLHSGNFEWHAVKSLDFIFFWRMFSFVLVSIINWSSISVYTWLFILLRLIWKNPLCYLIPIWHRVLASGGGLIFLLWRQISSLEHPNKLRFEVTPKEKETWKMKS